VGRAGDLAVSGSRSAGHGGDKSAGYGAIVLSEEEEGELYVVLKPREGKLAAPLDGLLRRVEQSLFRRLTVEEIEQLAARFPGER
jgi:hypothetical protein